ncbi:MAG: hypothetical protein N3G20_06070, partial [Verrucomicrobiae bacterium]|nr:hypothetical protein [Verrucomicrobiae bacterium]
SSVVTGFRSYGETLFRSDYAYACRLCPELDPDAAGAVYTNALAVLELEEFVQTAKNVVEQTSQTGEFKRPPAPMTDHYAVPFDEDNDPNDRQAYGELLNMLQSMAGYDPLSTDLFNDAVVYVMSMSFERRMAQQTARAYARIDFWERFGLPPSLDDLDGDAEDPPSLDSYLNDATENTFAVTMAGYREIFGYRFEEYHGLPREEAFAKLEKLTLPPATWVHIKPKPE